MRNCKSVVFLCWALLATPVVGEQLPQVVPISGSTLNARLMSIADERVVFLDDINHERTFATDELVRWGSLFDAGKDHQVLLTDGSQLVGQLTSISRTAIVFETDVWGELSVPRSVIASVMWDLPTPRVARWKFRDQFAKRIDRSRLLLRNGDFVSGRMLSGGRRWMKFQSDVGEVELKSELVAAWQPRDTGVTKPSDASIIGLRDGTKLVARSVRLDNRLEIDLVCGLHLGSMDVIRPVDERLVTYFQPMSENVTYLSDISEIGHKHIPFLTTSWDWKADRNVLGGPISSLDKVYARGIGMHSTSRLAYDLPKGFSQFQAEVSIDESSGKRGSVVFRVFLSDDGISWSEKYRSDTVTGGDLPRPVKVGIESAKRLALVIDFADRGDQLDRANWIGARLVKLAE